MRVPNPGNPDRKALVVAGICGIGTWGAAELVRKRAKVLTGKLPSSSQGDFAVLLRVVYKKYDIIASGIEDFVTLS